MSLAKWVEVNIVDPLTQGRHSLIRETALELGRLHKDGVSSTLPSDPNPSSSLSSDPRTGTIPTQILASLHFYPCLLLTLSSLVHIKTEKIDMGSLIRTPDELFVSEEEWAGKAIKERKEKAGLMDVDEPGKKTKGVKEEEKEEGVLSKPRYEAEGPEELTEVLDYVAGVIVELDKQNRVHGLKDTAESEDSMTRNLRLNLLALAKRAPLDTIARLPMDLVPEHIRHFVPTLAT